MMWILLWIVLGIFLCGVRVYFIRKSNTTPEFRDWWFRYKRGEFGILDPWDKVDYITGIGPAPHPRPEKRPWILHFLLQPLFLIIGAPIIFIVMTLVLLARLCWKTISLIWGTINYLFKDSYNDITNKIADRLEEVFDK